MRIESMKSVRSLGVTAVCTVVAVTLLVWGRARHFDHTSDTTFAALGLAVALCLWLARVAFQRHLATARASRGPYAVRYSGLGGGLAMWSGLTYLMVSRSDPQAATLEERAWLFLLLRQHRTANCLVGGRAHTSPPGPHVWQRSRPRALTWRCS
jgi:hypothetical protein